MNQNEALIKEAGAVLDRDVLVPIVLKKCAERGFTPKTQDDMDYIMKVAGVVRHKLATGEIAPVPMQYLDEKGGLSKSASVALSKDPMAFAQEYNVDLDQVAAHVKEAAAVALWGSLEAELAAAANQATK